MDNIESAFAGATVTTTGFRLILKLIRGHHKVLYLFFILLTVFHRFALLVPIRLFSAALLPSLGDYQTVLRVILLAGHLDSLDIQLLNLTANCHSDTLGRRTLMDVTFEVDCLRPE